MTHFADCYRGRRVLVTGHTGFKGSWLCLWLSKLGAEIIGYALDPEHSQNHWDQLNLEMFQDIRADIRDASKVEEVIHRSSPEIVFHLAAQPLVRRSYSDPLETWSTNVQGTVNLLNACRDRSVKSIVCVTTDKVYENKEWPWGYREADILGGHDPYSSSKAAAELVIDSFRKCYFTGAKSALVASARAGNVIGGGDWSEDRLVPDIARAVSKRTVLEIRSPTATRPWQHVLECISGYLLLGQRLMQGDASLAGPWNFGPSAEGNRRVDEVLTKFQAHWSDVQWNINKATQPHESRLLYLDTSKARLTLQWTPIWEIDRAISATADWYKHFAASGEPISSLQLDQYSSDAQLRSAVWAHT